jgi:DNA-binding transcriptional MerR regulator
MKSASAFVTIGEASKRLQVAPHVLRFWETQFPQIQPVRSAGGRRHYRPEDLRVLERIQKLLHEDLYTIEGARRVLRRQPSRAPQALEHEELSDMQA